MTDFSLGIKHQLFNNEVRKRRVERGLTQKELSNNCGIGESTIGHIETLRKYPTMKQAKSIAQALSSTVEELFPKWIEEFKHKKTSVVTEHFVSERILEHPELKMLPAEAGNIDEVIDSVDAEIMSVKIDSVLNTLKPREKKVLELRFGLKDEKTHTYEEVGKEFGVTRERIRQIEAKALRKLKHPVRKKELEGLL